MLLSRRGISALLKKAVEVGSHKTETEAVTAALMEYVQLAEREGRAPTTVAGKIDDFRTGKLEGRRRKP